LTCCHAVVDRRQNACDTDRAQLHTLSGPRCFIFVRRCKLQPCSAFARLMTSCLAGTLSWRRSLSQARRPRPTVTSFWKTPYGSSRTCEPRTTSCGSSTNSWKRRSGTLSRLAGRRCTSRACRCKVGCSRRALARAPASPLDPRDPHLVRTLHRATHQPDASGVLHGTAWDGAGASVVLERHRVMCRLRAACTQPSLTTMCLQVPLRHKLQLLHLQPAHHQALLTLQPPPPPLLQLRKQCRQRRRRQSSWPCR
jgi:hypothetical protein